MRQQDLHAFPVEIINRSSGDLDNCILLKKLIQFFTYIRPIHPHEIG